MGEGAGVICLHLLLGLSLPSRLFLLINHFDGVGTFVHIYTMAMGELDGRVRFFETRLIIHIHLHVGIRCSRGIGRSEVVMKITNERDVVITQER